MAPANTANLTRDTTTDQKTLPRANQSPPRAPHQTDVVFPPKRDSDQLCRASKKGRCAPSIDRFAIAHAS
jgi:hypothetical protein